MSNEKEAMPSLKKNEIESRPRSREKGSTRSRENMSGDMNLYFLCNFPERTEGRAPEPLHVGRRPVALAQPEVDDPGSKGERVAWKTAPSTGRTRQRTDARATASISPGGEMDGGRCARRPWP
jgi:hypothetical protein